MRAIIAPVVMSSLALAGQPALAATMHATAYFQVVKPSSDLTPDVDRWQPAVKSDLQRHINDLVDEINGRIPNLSSRVILKLNKDTENYIPTRYQDPEFSKMYQDKNSVQISVIDNFKVDGKTKTRTDVYFGTLKGDLNNPRVEYIEDGNLRSPNRSANALKYMLTYAWAMDFAANKKEIFACPLLARATQMEGLPDIRRNAGLGNLKVAVRKSYSRLGCEARLGDVNAR
jgi:hypothetical protein